MPADFDLSQFDEYREDNRREVKKANGGLKLRKEFWRMVRKCV